jgi:hypothetical protein
VAIGIVVFLNKTKFADFLSSSDGNATTVAVAEGGLSFYEQGQEKRVADFSLTDESRDETNLD